MQDLASEFSTTFRGWYPRSLTAGGATPSHTQHPAQAPRCWDPKLGPPQLFSRGCAPGPRHRTVHDISETYLAVASVRVKYEEYRLISLLLPPLLCSGCNQWGALWTPQIGSEAEPRLKLKLFDALWSFKLASAEDDSVIFARNCWRNVANAKWSQEWGVRYPHSKKWSVFNPLHLHKWYLCCLV